MRLRFKKGAIPEMKKNEYVIFDGKNMKGKWKNEFSNDNPIYLEIGSGKGDFIIKSAIKNPSINYIGLEMNTNAFVATSRKIIENELTNVRGLIGYGENLDEYFEKKEISKIFLNFSTPWPKRKHHKRRLSHKRFLDIYKKIIKDDTELELKTDNYELYLASLEYFKDNNLEILEVDEDLSMENSIVTEYERKFRDRNMPIYFIKARFLSQDHTNQGI